MDKTSRTKASQVQRLYEIFLSLNVALVILYALIAHNVAEASYSGGSSNAYSFLYWFFRAAVRMNKLLHYQPPVSRINILWPDGGGRPGVELAFVLSTAFTGLLFTTILQLGRGTRLYRVAQRPLGGLVFVLMFPATYVLLFDAGHLLFFRSGSLAMRSTWIAAIPELLCAGALLLVSLLRPLSARMLGVLLLLHYSFWGFVYFGNDSGDMMYGQIPPSILLLLIPFGGLVWLLEYQMCSKDPSVKLPEIPRKTWLVGSFVVAAAGLGALWLPGPGHSLVHAKNRDSLTIEMSRSNCQMGCPVYSVTVHGTGAVEYVGEHYVKVRSTQAASLSEEQVRTILEGFDRAGFFGLEDQAFAWGYHASRVTVEISVDGKTKSVTSDTYHIGAKSGPQAKFVEAAATLDRIVGTDRWVKCGEVRCQL